jgi:hypothetical protein
MSATRLRHRRLVWSGRRARLAAGFLVTGLVVGVIGAGPADAHLTGRHIVRISGRMLMTDFDDIDADDVCDVPFSTDRTLTPTSSNPNPGVTIDLVEDCDEVRGAFRLVVTLGAPYNATSGFAKVSETDCFIFCSRHQIGQKPYRADLADNVFQRAGPVTIEDAYGRVTFDFTYSIAT